MPHKLPKCSKCGGSPCGYRELAATSIHFDLTNNKFNEANEYLNPNYTGIQRSGFNHNNVLIESTLGEADNIGKVEAECGACGHTWILRNFRTIEALIDLHGFNEGKKI